MVKSLREYIIEAEKNKAAIGHFNIANIEGLWGVFGAAREISKLSTINYQLPVIIGVSEGERDFIGIKQAVTLVKSLREEYDYPIFINADHTYSFDRVKEAIDAGFDMVIFDGAQLSFEENVKISKQCADYAKGKISAAGVPILVEGELGFIGLGSNIKEGVPEGITKTSPEDAKKFVEETGIDLFAPSVGNIHGMVKGGNPHIDAELIKKIRKEAGVPLVLHGGSGITDDDFVKGINAGISIIHISTELRVAYKNALKMSLQENPDELAPYKILKPAVKAIQKAAEDRLKLFNKIK
ncbi:hypothetical protein A3A09_02230 [Candidatus Nomurabacteria bacterium RIFCSPLOWO2_01_FULL_42_20]|uniref:Tagatose-bisphosphate aldolase n=1 Tax=Candidatus Nomurabacteria bacterium RIFCSPHIGHO2_01_FULL_42_16 TaxID=1801743 RepID=A0A1F6VHK2_9BACT|nr:MAG: hypothetical protein A2824_01950 [Candidatus Nomurabacteria bacterium RIFCSPHIGHO2_01_FULL_42_16]OGI92098.1 MAG: hypothetical protein A3A09_02230 [Candidatus Nomurabacteria bacterium RIFCSPLOWO2_01_FULL_42_20]